MKSFLSPSYPGWMESDSNAYKGFLSLDDEVTIEEAEELIKQIKDDNLRPFKIMGEVQKSLNGKTINGLGKMTGGDFALNYISDEVIDYIQYFTITSYD